MFFILAVIAKNFRENREKVEGPGKGLAGGDAEVKESLQDLKKADELVSQV